ncbi:MAG: hypothetical protein HXY34_11605 [Candidatus Thorarchaeota archaeon]|nr:hypothetical protein [Candidatus Thorarchaeota archaeon]
METERSKRVVVGYRAHPGIWEGAIRILYWSSTVLMIAYISLALGYLMGFAVAIPIVMTSRSTEPSLKRAVLNYEEQHRLALEVTLKESV